MPWWHLPCLNKCQYICNIFQCVQNMSSQDYNLKHGHVLIVISSMGFEAWTFGQCDESKTSISLLRTTIYRFLHNIQTVCLPFSCGIFSEVRLEHWTIRELRSMTLLWTLKNNWLRLIIKHFIFYLFEGPSMLSQIILESFLFWTQDRSSDDRPFSWLYPSLGWVKKNLSPTIKLLNCFPRMQALVGPTSPPGTDFSDKVPVKASIWSTLV